MREMYVLTKVEVDGQTLGFEHGMLLFHKNPAATDGHWHAVLLGVPPADMHCISDPQARCALAAKTSRGERLSGWVRPFRVADDCLRLIGLSAPEWEGA